MTSPPDDLVSALGGDYEILRTLGSGKAATVYLAQDRALGVLVAIKALNPRRAQEETARKRFEREARSAASLADHPNIVAVSRFGVAEGRTPWVIMQYVKGRTMEERLKAEGRLPVALAQQVLRDVASALSVAHAKGIVHRDVRLGNVLWDEEKERALLTDFGIAAVLDESGMQASRLTSTGQMLADPKYQTPEQLQDHAVTERSDVYLFGVLGYELLTGEGP
ncbi:MAG TPA: serine/threonine-protein kinase, partial [Longimicrobiales bacterium]|nr:serine/threonine-protein kinase [Longimicrobiales bacterium]